jgi:hypothetical protein
MILRDKIPAIYHPLFPELLDIEFPEEKIATCVTCNLCRSEKSPYINTKCCTYHPHLANYLIGGVFMDEEDSLSLGKERIRNQIKARAGVTPYGIIPTVPYEKVQKEAENQEFWSKSKELVDAQLCPYYDKGHCTVWKYRENLCVTHFCSSVGGAKGQIFWRKLNKYIKMAETSLAQYAMLQLGWPPAKIKTEAVTTASFNIEDEKGNINDTNYTELWGEWVGREEEFYKKSYNIINSMDAATFKRITGLKREILEIAIRDTQQNVQLNILPAILLLNPEVTVEKGKDGYTRLVLGEVSAEITTVLYYLVRGFNGNRNTVAVFQLGYNLLINMSTCVDELLEKGMLIKY